MSVFWGHLILKLDERKKTALSLAFFHSWSSVDYAVGLPCTSHGPVGTKLGVFEHTLPSHGPVGTARSHQKGTGAINRAFTSLDSSWLKDRESDIVIFPTFYETIV